MHRYSISNLVRWWLQIEAICEIGLTVQGFGGYGNLDLEESRTIEQDGALT
jgi:hypothetical protein